MNKQSDDLFDDLESEDQNGIEQPTKEEIQSVCKRLEIPFNRGTAMALIYGDNKELPERILPYWLREM